ncbi:hypothetical protein FQR65_LT12519 [Abscondita terminalis]|nr:hypothetical protein FQR65_LT12519 [Abscondita terminalis]
MTTNRLVRRKGVVSSATVYSRSNSLDWDSPSTKTGTVKRRPTSIEYPCSNELNSTEKLSSSNEMKERRISDKATITSPIKSVYAERSTISHLFKSNAEAKQSIKLDLKDLITFDSQVRNTIMYRKPKIPLRDTRNRNKVKETNCIQDTLESKDDFKVDGFSFDNPKCFSLTEVNAYLIERKASGFNLGKAGMVSDSDSGIASPLSPSSLYGFVLCGDKNETCKIDLQIGVELERLRSCSCVQQQNQIGLTAEAEPFSPDVSEYYPTSEPSDSDEDGYSSSAPGTSARSQTLVQPQRDFHDTDETAGSDEIYGSNWFAYKSLEFLFDKNCPRKTLSTIPDEDSQSETLSIAADTDTEQEHNSAAQNKKEDNECDLFGKLVAKKLDSYSKVTRINVQKALMDIIFQADSGFYDQLQPGYPNPLNVSRSNFQYVYHPNITSNNKPHNFQQSQFSNPTSPQEYPSICSPPECSPMYPSSEEATFEELVKSALTE